MCRLTICSLVILWTCSAFAQSPVIVANVSLLNQISTIFPTTLVTPSSDALYRITAYMEMTKTNTSNWSWCANFFFNDGLRKRGVGVEVETNSDNDVSSGVFVAADKAGVPLTYSVTDCSGTKRGKEPFNLFFTIEQLQ